MLKTVTKKMYNNPRAFFSSAFSKVKYCKDIYSLPVVDSGISNDCIPYIALKDGFIFYGYLPTALQKSMGYLFFKKINPSCINVAYDISFRYFGPYSRNKHTNIKNGDVVLEIGAYIGYYAMLASKLVGESGKVIAVEAIPENYDLLKKNININNLKNIIVHNSAAWEATCTLNFYRHKHQRASAIQNIVEDKEQISVTADKIDNILDSIGISKIDFVRIQVNGAEIEVLKGMSKTLENYPKLLIAAIYDRESLKSSCKIASLLNSLGYKTEVMQGNVFAYKNNDD